MKHKNEHFKTIQKEYESKFNDCTDIDEEEMNNYINKKLGEFPIRKIPQELTINDLLWDFDAISLYPNAMIDPESVYPRIETRYAFTPDMNEDLVNKFKNQTFTQEVLY